MAASAAPREGVVVRLCPSEKRDPDVVVDKHSIRIEGTKRTFERVYGHRETTDVVYEESVRHLVDAALAGKYGGWICALGGAGTGKSHTIFGSERRREQKITEDSVVHNTLNHIYERVQQDTAKHYEIRVSCMEIDSGRVFDLLQERAEVVESCSIEGSGIAEESVVSDINSALEQLRRGLDARNRCTTWQEKNKTDVVIKVIIDLESKSNDGLSRRARTVLSIADLAEGELVNLNTSEIGVEKRRKGLASNQDVMSLGTAIGQLSCGRESGCSVVSKSMRDLIFGPAMDGCTNAVFICTVSAAPLQLKTTTDTLHTASQLKAVTNSCHKPLRSCHKPQHPASQLKAVTNDIATSPEESTEHKIARLETELAELRERNTADHVQKVHRVFESQLSGILAATDGGNANDSKLRSEVEGILDMYRHRNRAGSSQRNGGQSERSTPLSEVDRGKRAANSATCGLAKSTGDESRDRPGFEHYRSSNHTDADRNRNPFGEGSSGTLRDVSSGMPQPERPADEAPRLPHTRGDLKRKTSERSFPATRINYIVIDDSDAEAAEQCESGEDDDDDDVDEPVPATLVDAVPSGGFGPRVDALITNGLEAEPDSHLHNAGIFSLFSEYMPDLNGENSTTLGCSPRALLGLDRQMDNRSPAISTGFGTGGFLHRPMSDTMPALGLSLHGSPSRAARSNTHEHTGVAEDSPPALYRQGNSEHSPPALYRPSDRETHYARAAAQEDISTEHPSPHMCTPHRSRATGRTMFSSPEFGAIDDDYPAHLYSLGTDVAVDTLTQNGVQEPDLHDTGAGSVTLEINAGKQPASADGSESDKSSVHETDSRAIRSARTNFKRKVDESSDDGRKGSRRTRRARTSDNTPAERKKRKRTRNEKDATPSSSARLARPRRAKISAMPALTEDFESPQQMETAICAEYGVITYEDGTVDYFHQ